MKRTWATSLAVAGVTLALQSGSQPAMAQEAAFPTKPARMIFGFAPGGSGDLAARLLAEKATAVFGQPQQNLGNAYVPRQAQFAFRLGF